MLFEKGWSLCFSVLSLEWLQILLALYRFYSPVKNFVTCSTGRSESADLSLFVQSVGSCQNIWTVHRPRRCSVNFYVRLGSHSVCVCVCLHVCVITPEHCVLWWWADVPLTPLFLVLSLKNKTKFPLTHSLENWGQNVSIYCKQISLRGPTPSVRMFCVTRLLPSGPSQ